MALKIRRINIVDRDTCKDSTEKIQKHSGAGEVIGVCLIICIAIALIAFVMWFGWQALLWCSAFVFMPFWYVADWFNVHVAYIFGAYVSAMIVIETFDTNDKGTSRMGESVKNGIIVLPYILGWIAVIVDWFARS